MKAGRALVIGTAVLAAVGAALAVGAIDLLTVTEDELSVAPDGTRYIDYASPLDVFIDRCKSPSTTASLQRVQFVHQGFRRELLYYVPPRRSERPAALIVLHGSGSTAEQVHVLLGEALVQIADREGLVLLYGNGFAGGWNDLRSRSPHLAKKLNLDEISYFRWVLDWAEQTLGIDRNRVFYLGMSNGAQMIMKLLVEAPELVTAAALVGANLPRVAALDERCERLRPRPVMFVNGTADSIVPYEGGKSRVLGIFDFGEVHSAETTAMCWVASANVQAPPLTTHIDTREEGTSIDLRRWSEPGKPEIRAYRVNGGKHTIPMPPRGTACDKLVSTSHDMNTIEEAWSFFHSQSAALSQPGAAR